MRPLFDRRAWMIVRVSALLFLPLAFAACQATPINDESASVAAAQAAPEGATARQGPPAGEPRRAYIAKDYMVAAAHPDAAEAGRAILAQGGSAIDAAVAVQMVLTLVEPQSSGIGGGGFLLFYDAKTKKVDAYDGRETAPAAIEPDVFLADGQPMAFYDAAVGGQAIGVPGVVRMLELAHKEHGKLPWRDLFQPAIERATEGFVVTPRLNALLANERYLKAWPRAAAYFFQPDGSPWPVGHVLTNPDLAATLTAIANGGARAFYEGEIARDIVQAVRAGGGKPGVMTARDLSSYRAKKRPPLCRPYRSFNVCTMPPPTSGGLATLQILGIIEPFALNQTDPGSIFDLHLILEASRLAFADRNAYLADPDFFRVPVNQLLSPAYLTDRRNLIKPDGIVVPAEPGIEISGLGLEPADEKGLSTSHMSIVDKAGNAVSFTSSIENAFGSRQFVRGFLLNNQLTDFSFEPTVDGKPVANAVAGGKRPRSSMAPTIVLDRDTLDFVLATGSPGGSRIIAYTVKSIIATLDWDLDVQKAVDYPNFSNRNGVSDIEAGTELADVAGSLEALGHTVRFGPMASGLHIIRRTPNGYLAGGADYRREGVVLGE